MVPFSTQRTPPWNRVSRWSFSASLHIAMAAAIASDDGGGIPGQWRIFGLSFSTTSMRRRSPNSRAFPPAFRRLANSSNLSELRLIGVYSPSDLIVPTSRQFGVIEALSNSGKQIEAVNLAYAFELTEQFAPVPLLKAFLKESRKISQAKAGNMSPSAQDSAQNEMNEREMSALKAIIKCIEEHKLEEHYPVDPLLKRVLQLEKAKADRKRVAEVAKPQSKRPRANAGNGIGYAPPRVSNVQEKSFYRAPERYPFPYERQYIYPMEAHVSPPLLSPAAYGLSHNHGSYYGSGYQYQPPYIH